jgi:hypothetical protein
MNTIRGGKITDDEPISERLVEAWIHQYRAKLIKQDIDKGKFVNPDYVQSISLELEEDIQPTRTLYKTTIIIPKTLDFNYKSGILFVGDVEGNIIQLVPEQRVIYQQYRKFTRNAPLAYIRDQYLYIHNPRGLQYVYLRGIFEVPTEADATMTLDSKYPIPINMVTILKDMIKEKELGIITRELSDSTNDSQHLLESNISQQVNNVFF